jgi:sec-independent protein translocase protein TatA
MFGSSEMVIVLVIVLVIFGGSQLPKLARNLGRAQREFKEGMEEASKPAPADPAPSAGTAKAETTVAPEPAKPEDA